MIDAYDFPLKINQQKFKLKNVNENIQEVL